VVEGNAEQPCFRPDFDARLHVYQWRGLTFPGVTTVLRASNVLALPPVDHATLAMAAERGTLIHAACAKADGLLVPDSDIHEPSLNGYMDAYAAFKESRCFTPVPAWTETPLCDPQLQVAGTPDRVGYTGEHTGTVVDLKTPLTRDPGYGVQLAGYRHLLRVNGFKAPRRLAVYLRPNGTFRVVEHADLGDDAAFLASLSLYRWRMRQKGLAAA
jgi:hypothetical protein